MKNPIHFKQMYSKDRLSVALDAIIMVTELSGTRSCFLKLKGLEKEIQVEEDYDVVMERIRLYS